MEIEDGKKKKKMMQEKKRERFMKGETGKG